MYQLEKRVSRSHVGKDGKLTLTTAVDFMQDCSSAQINSVEALTNEFVQRKMAMWIISRQMDILTMPALHEKLIVKTWVWDLNRVYGSRNTVIYNEQGQACVISHAIGAFVLMDTGHLTQISKKTHQEIHIETKLDMDYVSRKIKIPSVVPLQMAAVPVLKSHIDHYNHVNNAKYVMIAYHYLPDDFSVKRLRVEYKIPAIYGDIMQPLLYTQKEQVISLNNAANKPFAVIEFSILL
jgi:acyl-ACP thioesterase